MLDRIRRLNISLAAKCQLLFGSAVVLIIGAALFVPWQRMEQLTDQLNPNAAAAVASDIITTHVRTAVFPTTAPIAVINSGIRAILNPHMTRTIAAESLGSRLIGLDPRLNQPLTAWEKNVLGEVRNGSSTHVFFKLYDKRDGQKGYRYAQVVTLGQDCVRCHTAVMAEHIGRRAATRPATATSTSIPLLAMPGQPPVLGFVSVDIPSQIRINQLLLNRVFLLTAGMLAGTLAIVVFYLITTRLILQPVHVLQEAAEMVSKGDLNIRSHINTGDEFQQLSETFNTMLANLSRNAEQLRSINKSLDLKVGQLAESNVALYESNRLKSEFLANVSHELRTPLNSILGFAELLKDLTAPDVKSARYVSNILQSGKNLLELINDLLDLAKIEAGRMEVRSEPLSLNDLFEGLTSILKPVTEARHLDLKSTVSADVPIINTDPPKLQQVLYNFLSNAIKFSPDGGSIRLSAVVHEQNQVRISVTDEGPGIATDQQNLIFEKFRQIDGSVTRQHSGTGLGLAISKELTALLEGEIGVQSDPGQGATFWIVLPLHIQPSIKDVRARLVLT